MINMVQKKVPIEETVDEDGYFVVSCPLLKGCRTYGATRKEALLNLKECIEMCLEDPDEHPFCKLIEYRDEELIFYV